MMYAWIVLFLWKRINTHDYSQIYWLHFNVFDQIVKRHLETSVFQEKVLSQSLAHSMLPSE